MELILGIDDAGRGPVVGPMVLAACLLDDKSAKELKRMGVKDSKDLTHKRREFLSEKIKEKAEAYEVTLASPLDIDNSLENGKNLNELEAKKTAELINKINKGFKKIKVIVDCPSISRVKWRNSVLMKIENLSNLEIVCEHKADRNHIPVAAASILAKSEREKEMKIIREKFGDEVGSGYTSDDITSKFVEENAEKHKDAGIFRRTWQTWKISFRERVQKKL